uniref:Uncharacterized protein n=1 Tax=Candidatus Kentrum sp. LFY TaxID=2126342 RepID=A0A450WBK4_9GAMM|nr:MAG: hypothetical protein BECKLFY1418C_GA0070996_100827 [Candidatus Kentron sp. LFY]
MIFGPDYWTLLFGTFFIQDILTIESSSQTNEACFASVKQCFIYFPLSLANESSITKCQFCFTNAKSHFIGLRESFASGMEKDDLFAKMSWK